VGPQQVAHKSADGGVATTAKVLGWDIKEISFDVKANAPAEALGSALQLKPDAVLNFGSPSSLLRPQLLQAASQNTPVILSDNGETPGKTGTTYQVNVQGNEQTGLWGTITGAYAAAQGAKHVLVVNLSQYAVLAAYTKAATDTLTKYGVKNSVLDTTAQGLGSGAVPGQIVSAVQKNPDIDWVLLSLGDMATGLHPALNAAGFSRVKIGGEGASEADIAALKNGTEAVWAAFPAAIAGTYRFDAAVRVLGGEDPTKINYLTPTQLLTPDNVRTAPLDADNYYVGVPGYLDFFTKLWKAHC
jgi:ABC-type sugar transport system substrate-binding protein